MTGALIYGVSAGIALAILYGLARSLIRRRRRTGDPALGSPAPELRVLSRERVGSGRSLVIVEVDGRRLLLGSSSGQWSTLADLGRAPAPLDRELSGIDAELARALNASSRHGRGFRRN